MKHDDLATMLLADSPLTTDDAARLILELLETTGELENNDRTSLVAHCHNVIQRGAKDYAHHHQTLPFYRVVEEHLKTKVKKRPRTISEIRQICFRIMACCPHWRNHPLRTITPDECKAAIEETFGSPVMQRKAHQVLHGLFKLGLQRGLCEYNPLTRIEAPRPEEKHIQILSIPQIRRLLETACLPEHVCCAPALGIMLWAGIRPTEIERITWSQVHLKEKFIDVEPRHAKTGGARQVTIQPVLGRWLRKVCKFTPSHASITPKAWAKRWRSLRHDAKLKNWQADTLRHCFASYHLRHFRDLNALQLEMGHAGTELLRTRYLSMAGLTKEAARQFWGVRDVSAEDKASKD